MMTAKTDLDQIKRIYLPEFLTRHYSVYVIGGKAHCPFHPPDKKKSFSVFKNDSDVWRWKCFHDGQATGTIIDFVSRMDSLSVSDSIAKIRQLEGRSDVALAGAQVRKIEKLYDYNNADGKLVFQKVRYVPKSFACRMPESQGWNYSIKGVKAVPYRLDKIKDSPRVFLCEGEKDADLLAGLGYPATSAPFGAGSWPAELNPYFCGKAVYILYDVGNEGKVQNIAAELWGFTKEIYILSVPLEKREADISDCLDPIPADEDRKAKLEDVIFHAQKYQPPKAVRQPAGPILAERSSDSVRVRAIPWLWHGVLPTHMATAFTGDPGHGKSLVMVDIAAHVSTGRPFPVYDKPGPAVKGHVFYVTSEGVPEMILVPRLIAAGADLSKITIIEGVYLRKDHFSMFDITQNLPQVARRAQDFPDLKLVVFDPIASFIPERINTNQQNAVRQAMDRISDLAFKLGIAVPAVMHFSKTAGVKAIHKTAGSVQFEASVKMSWSVIRRQDDPRNARVLVPQKTNITGGYKSLTFSIHQVEFPAPHDLREIITTAKINYGGLVDDDPEFLISPRQEIDNNVLRACDFLKQRLREGTTLYAKPLIDEAEQNGIPKWALYKAKDRLGVLHDKEAHFQGRTFWFRSEKETDER